MKELGIILACLTYLNTNAGQLKERIVVNFETDRYIIRNSETLRLSEWLSQIDLTRDYIIRISGHTDDAGSYSYNNQLSQQRAEVVMDFLIANGIPNSSIDFSFYGETKPVTSNSTPEDMLKNRRVEVVYSSYYFSNASELLDSLSPAKDRKFIIDPMVPNSLNSGEDLSIRIDSKSFMDDSGKIYEGKVELTIKEGMDFESYLKHDLMTISEGSALESDGMFFLEARGVDGTKLNIDSNSNITADLKTGRRKKKMELFVSDDGKNWSSTGRIDRKEKKKMKKGPKLIEIPRFVPKTFIADKSTMPKPPEKPGNPRDPHQPRIESYQPAGTIWNSIFRKKAEEKANERYLSAMDKYLERVGKHEVRMANYLIAKERYMDKYEKYEKEYDEWLKYQDFLAMEYTKRQYRQYQEYWGPSMRYNDSIKQSRFNIWKRKREARLNKQAEALDSAGNANISTANSYALRVTQMGWFNIDKYMDTEERVLAVWDNDESDEIVRLVMPGIRGMIGLIREDDAYQLRTRIPSNESMIVFGLKVKNGSPYIYLHRLKEDEVNLEMQYTKTRFSDLKGILEDMQCNKVAVL